MRGRTFIGEFTVFFFKKLYMNMFKKFRDSFMKKIILSSISF